VRKSSSNTLNEEQESTCRFAKCGKYDSETSSEPAIAIQELLRGAKWRFVQFFGALY